MTQLYKKEGRRYVPTTLSEQEAWGSDGLMALAAFRYCLGRMTYIVGDCERWIFANWENFPESVRKLIQRDLEEEFARDDEARERGAAREIRRSVRLLRPTTGRPVARGPHRTHRAQ